MNEEKRRIIICTDGSAITGKHSAYDSAAAMVIYDDKLSMIHKESFLLRDHTNNYAELYAVYRATKFCMYNIEDITTYDQIVIVTDSELTQKSLTVWMMGWMKKAKDEILINSSGVAVKNQELMKSTFMNILMLQLKVDVFVCHVNSHQSEVNMQKMYEKFIKSFPITFNEFGKIYEGNDICDKLAKKELGI